MSLFDFQTGYKLQLRAYKVRRSIWNGSVDNPLRWFHIGPEQPGIGLVSYPGQRPRVIRATVGTPADGEAYIVGDLTSDDARAEDWTTDPITEDEPAYPDTPPVDRDPNNALPRVDSRGNTVADADDDDADTPSGNGSSGSSGSGSGSGTGGDSGSGGGGGDSPSDPQPPSTGGGGGNGGGGSSPPPPNGGKNCAPGWYWDAGKGRCVKSPRSATVSVTVNRTSAGNACLEEGVTAGETFTYSVSLTDPLARSGEIWMLMVRVAGQSPQLRTIRAGGTQGGSFGLINSPGNRGQNVTVTATARLSELGITATGSGSATMRPACSVTPPT